MKIASLLPSATEIICALGLKDSLVGVTHECDFPPGVEALPHLTASRISHQTMSSSEIDHAVRSQLDGHGTLYDLHTELLDSLRPELIITQELCDVCAVNYQIVSQASRSLTVDNTLVSLEPKTIGDIFETILTVGEHAGIREKAEALVADLGARLAAVIHKVEFINERPRVMMLEWLEPPFAPGHWVPEQVETAGGICLLGEAGQRSLTTTFEAIIETDPEVLVLIPCGFYIDDIVRQLEFTRFPAAWREITAVKNGNIWAMDASSYFSRPGPRVVEGVERLSRILHPNVFGQPTREDGLKIAPDSFRYQ